MQDHKKHISLEKCVSPLVLIRHTIEYKNEACEFPNCHLARVQCHHVKHCQSSSLTPCSSSGFCLTWKRLLKQNSMNVHQHECTTCPQPIKVLPSTDQSIVGFTRFKRVNMTHEQVGITPLKKRRMSSAASSARSSTGTPTL